MISYLKSTIVVALLLCAQTYAEDAIDPDYDNLNAKASSAPLQLIIQPIDYNAVNMIMSEDLSMHALGSSNRRRQFEVSVGIKTDDMTVEYLASTNAGFEHMDIDLPGAGSFSIEKTTGIENHWTGMSTDPQDFSELYVKYDPQMNHFLITLNCANGNIFKVNTRADGSTWATVLLPMDRMMEQNEDMTEDIDENHDFRGTGQASGCLRGTEEISKNFRPLVDSGDVVDIIVAYTTAAMCDEAVGSTSCSDTATNRAPIEQLIQTAVDNNNIAHKASQTGTQLRLVHTYLASGYTEPSDQITALYDFQKKDDGKLDEVHTLRQTYKADLAAIILNIGSGVAFAPASYKYAFSTTNKDYIAGHTFAHELGHNFGCYHDRQNSGIEHDYAHGFQNPGANIRSILSYPCSGSNCQVVNRYSSPHITYNGNKIGTFTDDCARKINERRVRVANFEDSNDTAPPVTPAPVTPAPVTPAPITPAPVTPAPVTPTPFTPAPVTSPNPESCDDIIDKKECNRTYGCAYNKIDSECKDSLSASECAEFDEKKRKCRRHGCKFNNMDNKCIPRW